MRANGLATSGVRTIRSQSADRTAMNSSFVSNGAMSFPPALGFRLTTHTAAIVLHGNSPRAEKGISSGTGLAVQRVVGLFEPPFRRPDLVQLVVLFDKVRLLSRGPFENQLRV